MTEYYIWKHEGGLKKKLEEEGSFDSKEDAQERCGELNENNRPSGATWGYQVHPEE